VNVAALLLELYGRIPRSVHKALDGMTREELMAAPAPGVNPAAWIVWHLTRVQDHHVSGVAGTEQLWVSGDWAAHFGLEPDPENTGNGHTDDEVRSVQPDHVDVLVGYLDAVGARTRSVLQAMSEADLDRVVDHNWDPPVTAGVRLVSVANDNLQHAGQVAYIRGLLRSSASA